MRRFRKTWVLVVVAVVVIGGGFAGARAIRASAQRARNAAASYSTAKATRGALEVTVTGTGTLSPESRQDCVVAAGGKVVSVAAQPGQVVRAGETLLVLSNDSLEDQVASARLELRLAQMDLDAMTKAGSGSATRADIAAAEAAVLNARLALDRAEENVSDLTVKAPFAGRVSGLGVRAGDEVPAGTTLLTVASAADLKAVLSVPEEEVKHLSMGQAVTVTVSPLTRDLDGHISAIGAQGTSSARGVFYQVTVTLDSSDPQARGGMTVTAELQNKGSWPSDTVKVSGVLSYDRIQPVTTATGGTVASVAVAEDQTVAKDQTLLTMTSSAAGAALAASQADYARAQEKLAQLTDPGSSAFPQAQVEKTRLRVEEVALNLAGLERQLDELTVKADIDGTVTQVAFRAGDRVPPNQRVAAVADLGRVEAVVTVDELQVARLEVGQTAMVRIDALPGESFTGTLESLSLEGTVRDGVTAYEARVVFDGDARMRTGMSLSATIQVAYRDSALLVPVEAVYGAGKEASVQVLEDGKPVARPVVAGLSNNTYTEIIDGLAEGETVVTGTLKADTNPFGGMGPPGGSSQSGGGD